MSNFHQLLSKNSIFDNQLNNLEESYGQFLSELREDISEDDVSPYLSSDFQEELKVLINCKELDSYGPLKFYWLNLIDKVVDTLALIDEEIDEPQELIGAYADSDLLGFVIELLEVDKNTASVLQQVLDFQELQIISFFRLHISEENWQPVGPVSYSLTPEIGEANGHLVLGEKKHTFFLEELADETIVPIVGYFPMERKIQVLVGENVREYEAVAQDIIKNESGIHIMPGFKKGGERDTAHFEKCQKATELIAELSSDLREVLSQYTHTITPVYENEVVSYSMAILPGFSCINMANRDYVDMIDDLLHENGHHFLNAALEGEEEIIFEDDDKIFFSPWRRALRPIRGLYHGTFTFYWAYRLFKELSFW